jgi:hypothetical protein
MLNSGIKYFRFFRIPIFLFLFFTFSTCHRKPTEPVYTNKIDFEFTNVYCSEVWISISKYEEGEKLIEIRRDDRTIDKFNFDGRDTVIIDKWLKPNTVYKYSFYYSGLLISIKQIKTLDTTSHEFEWSVHEFQSPFGLGYLYDVAVIDENNIWAVGEIYSDSSKKWEPYNIFHWNGTEWEKKKVYRNGWIAKINWIFAFSDKDIWFGPFIHWNGHEFEEVPYDSSVFWQARDIEGWGFSSVDMYVVGYRYGDGKGFIAHWNGSRWQRIESGLSGFSFTAIWGDINRKTGEREILCVGTGYANATIIVKISRSGIERINMEGIKEGELYDVWFKAGKCYYVVGASPWGGYQLYYIEDINSKNLIWKSGSFYNSLFAVRGNDFNDVFMFGFEKTHFNGYTWRDYRDRFNYGYFFGVDVKGDLVCAVGRTGGRGIALIGKRK